MFLNELSDKEKQSFASLCYHAAMANGVIEIEESELIKEYCKEMSIDCFSYEEAEKMDEVVKTFLSENNRIKKILIFELLGVMYSDGCYDDDEAKFISEFADKLGISAETVTSIETLINDYYQMVEKINVSLM